MTDIIRNWRSMANVANGIIPTALPINPESSDVLDFASDLLVFARHGDKLIESYGQEAYSNGLIKHEEIKECFSNVLSNALCDAIYLLQKAEDRLAEEEREGIRSDRDEHGTLNRAMQGV